jgi:GntR family transcriptional repressor for pyruvate dehydrogenase complex
MSDQKLEVIFRRTLSDQVAEAVLRLIIQQGLSEGDSLPATAELAEIFSVSRTVVREALAELSGRGLLKRQQGREGVFSLPGSQELEDLLAARLEHDTIDRLDLHEFRSLIEIGAARLAAVNATPSDIANIRQCLLNLKSSTNEDEHHEADLSFHQAIADASHNPLFALVLNALTPLLSESRKEAWSSYVASGGQLTSALQRHETIVELIASADTAAAAAAMEIDLEDARVALEHHIRQQNRASEVRKAQPR